MTIVYPLGKGSVLKDYELRMSLRSIEKYLTGYDKVVIVGEVPDWIQNIEHIPAGDHSKIGDENIMRKLTKACNDARVSDTFLYANDDHYLMTMFHVNHFPNFYHSTLEDYFKKRGPDIYGRRADHTATRLKEQGHPTKFFDVHTPILIQKEDFIKNVTEAPWDKTSFLVKSLYANSFNLEGTEEPDYKLQQPPQRPVKVFSTFPHMKCSVTRYLREHFPNISKYEKYEIGADLKQST